MAVAFRGEMYLPIYKRMKTSIVDNERDGDLLLLVPLYFAPAAFLALGDEQAALFISCA